MIRRTDESGAPDPKTEFTYYPNPNNGQGNVCTNNDPNASSRTFVDGERTDVTDETKYCIDGNSRVVRVTDARGNKRKNTWTANSNVKFADMTGTGDGQDQYEYNYDNEDNPTDATSPEGARSEAAYDDNTNPHSATSVNGDDSGGNTARWEYSYDDKNNLIGAEGDPDPNVTDDEVDYRYCWTVQGQIFRIDPVTQTGAKSNSTNPKRDTEVNGNPRSNADRCDAGSTVGNDTRFTYNAQNELQEVDKPQGGDETFTYDKLSRIATVTDGRGVTTHYTYDGLDHVVEAEHTQTGEPDQTVTWTYDRAGNMTQIGDLNGANTMDYDELNRKTSETGQGPSSQTDYSYDPAGNVLEVDVTGEPEETSYTYNKVNLVETVDDQRPGSDQITFDYDQHDKRKQTVYPIDDGSGGTNNLIQEARWNEDGNPKCIYSFRQSNAPSNGDNACPANDFNGLITYHGYNYDNPDNPNDDKSTSSKYELTELGGITSTYKYDDIMRLDKATTRPDDNPSSTPLRTFVYDYDRHSNLLNEKATGSTPGLETGNLWAAHNNGDEICKSTRNGTGGSDPGLSCGSTNVGETSYTHDDAGNLTQGTGTGPLGGASFDYNLPGQTETISPGGASLPRTQGYDGVMQDRRTTDGDTSMSYDYSGGLTSQATTGTGAHAELFVRDPGGKLLAMIDTTGGTVGDTRYYLTDDQDSVMATVDDTNTSGTTAVRYLYEPYGQTIRTWEDTGAGTGSTQYTEDGSASAPSNDDNPWRYVSGYHDPTTGLTKFGTRYYMPELATWTQPDPKNGELANLISMNYHEYSLSDPCNNTDEDGRCVEDLVMGTLGLFATVGGTALTVTGAFEEPFTLGLSTGQLLLGVAVFEVGVGTTAYSFGKAADECL